MCGFVGIYNFNGSSVSNNILHNMMDVQRHRGPDDQGIRLFSIKGSKRYSREFLRNDYITNNFEGGVGFNRLSILDLSVNGHQPMCNKDGSVFIAFNGEIYNAFDYRSELEAYGYEFRSNTDTEIILYLYEQYGFIGMIERLNGMFAISIVDLNNQCIYLTRDRIGIKPLYWYECDGTFLFSSEVKSFLFHPSFNPELNKEKIDEYLIFRYCSQDGHLLKGVNQLEPGHYIIIKPDGWKKFKYWDIPDTEVDHDLSFNEALESFEDHLKRSVKMRLISDVKLGCQLSGGIDSSIINIYAKEQCMSELDSFSIIFDDPYFSEEQWIDKASTIAGVKNHKYVFDEKTFLNNIFNATWALDQPINHPNSLGIYTIAEKARSIVTVLLSGEGADELLGGYNRFLYAKLRDSFKSFSPLLSKVPYIGSIFSNKFSGLTSFDSINWFIAQSAFSSSENLVSLKPDINISSVFAFRRNIFENGKGEFVNNCLKYDMKTYLVDLLVRQDKMTMAHSMENRVPFLDHKLVEFVKTLPIHFYIKLNESLRQIRMRSTKIILKELASKYFDSDFIYRKKSGFALPLKNYFMNPVFSQIMEDLVIPGIHNRGILRTKIIKNWWSSIKDQSNEIVECLWICIAFELWAQQFVDKK